MADSSYTVDPAIGQAVETEPPSQTQELNLQSIIPKSILSALRESFPQEAVETITKDDGFQQTGIRPAWVIERLNEVLGIEGWDAEEVEIKENGNDVATKVRLNVYVIADIKEGLSKVLVATRTQWGSARKKGRQEYGDLLKSAYTNALCKCASMLDVAHTAYKGQLKPVVKEQPPIIDVEEAKAYDEAKKEETKQEAPKKRELEPTEPDVRSARKRLRDIAAAKRTTRNKVQEISEREFGKAQSKDLTLEELTQLIDILERLEDEPDTENGESDTDQNKP